jgi:hypothetical protein
MTAHFPGLVQAHKWKNGEVKLVVWSEMGFEIYQFLKVNLIHVFTKKWRLYFPYHKFFLFRTTYSVDRIIRSLHF